MPVGWQCSVGRNARPRIPSELWLRLDEVNDVWGLGLGYTAIGIGLYASAQYEDSLGQLHEAMRLFEKAGDMWTLHLARFHKGCCHYGRGELGRRDC